MVDVNLFTNWAHEYNCMKAQIEEQKQVIKELQRELEELKEETHRTKDGAIVKLKDMSNLHILRYLRIKFENNYNDRDRFINELLNRGFGYNGSITVEDAKELGFCSSGIKWAKNHFDPFEERKVSPRALLLYLLNVKNDLTYCVHIVDSLLHFCYKTNIANETRQ